MRAVRELRARHAGLPLLFLCWTLATYAIVTVNLGFDSSHYFGPLVSLNMVLGGLALVAGFRGLWRVARGRPVARPVPASVSEVPGTQQEER